ncbi:hypothetical protein B1813_10720 [Saccharomonospora piscinae]|uniref:Uncharacterized protein n=1 Tax=Saccharomonospora piscinae TaxID=687388 RepID=A0A1V9A669_SACPI|nr:hypothetical protein [Saccharomonospora piscinae]OQO92632.1 hypothetical protein B1813_10720 [Saccharomonospora piscinae]TLW91662.1 hypothetical protein FFT09_12015 [Saccharomonospora piscinae]
MTGYTVNIETVMQLAQSNYTIAEKYAEVTKKLTRTDDARDHLTDQYGSATEADNEIMSLLDEFEGYLKTTTARYYLTGEQLETAAGRYVEQEQSQLGQYREWRESFDRAGVGDYDLNWDPDEVAGDTERPEDATGTQPGEFGTEEDPAERDEQGREYLEDLEDSTEQERDR